VWTIWRIMRAAVLPLAMMGTLFGAQSRPSAQMLSDVEISAGYCLGVLDTMLQAAKAYEASNPSSVNIEEQQKIVLYYQEIERHRHLTEIERQYYDTAKTLYDVRKQILASYEERRADRERVRSYLMAKGIFSPSRTLDFAALLASINRGKADFQLCNNEQQNGPMQSCILKCATMNDTVARNACAEGCQTPSCKRAEDRCLNITWLPF
jgi:hypothetical protein